MASVLTKEELEFLEKIEKQRVKHNLAQKKYREKHTEEIKKYNKSYNDDKNKS